MHDFKLIASIPFRKREFHCIQCGDRVPEIKGYIRMCCDFGYQREGHKINIYILM